MIAALEEVNRMLKPRDKPPAEKPKFTAKNYKKAT